jgi:hypothetical protein
MNDTITAADRRQAELVGEIYDGERRLAAEEVQRLGCPGLSGQTSPNVNAFTYIVRLHQHNAGGQSRPNDSQQRDLAGGRRILNDNRILRRDGHGSA